MSAKERRHFDKPFAKRFWEIDSLRGIAIVMMIAFHFFYDLNYFKVYSINVYEGFWWAFARATATIFIFLVGISLTLSYARAKKSRTKADLGKKYFLRGIKIFSWGLLITAMTWIFLKEGFVVFGILHFIGIAIVLAYLFLGLKFWNLLLGIIFIFFGLYLKSITFDFYWLIWLGLKPNYFYAIDYFPLLPWFGVVLIGLFFGKMLYPKGKRVFYIADLSKVSFIKALSFLGRNSLLIYLIHQPILIALLYVLLRPTLF